MLRSFPKTALIIALCVGAQGALAQGSEDQRQQLSEQGRAALEAGRYADAEQAYAQLGKLEPGIAEIHVTLGVIYFKEGKFEQSATELRRALQLKPSLPRVESLLAMVLSEQDHFQEAVPGLEKGFHQSADPDLKRMCGLRLERAYTSMHDDAKAIETALELQRVYPDDPEVLYYSSKIFGNQAFLSAQKLFQTAPKSTWGMMAAAEAHESQGNLDQAIAEYHEVLKLDPARPNVHFRIGRALLARETIKGDAKDLEAAETEFQQELGLNPSSANAAYELAEIYRKQGHEDQARKYFQQAVDSYPAFEEAHVGLALTQLETDPASARTHLQKAVTLDPQDPIAWYRLAQAERALGHIDKQRKAMAEFAKLKNGQASSTRAALNPEVTPQELDPASVP
jgi:tetratricopeptide (TPR) repeat protein